MDRDWYKKIFSCLDLVKISHVSKKIQIFKIKIELYKYGKSSMTKDIKHDSKN